MLPRPRRFIPGSTAATSRYVAIRFSFTAATKSSSRISSTKCGWLGDPHPWPPRRGRRCRPNPSSASRTTSATCTASVRSPTTALQAPPSASIAAHTAANASVSRPCTLTRAPWRARWIAITRPMPRDAPVTSACRPASSELSAACCPLCEVAVLDRDQLPPSVPALIHIEDSEQPDDTLALEQALGAEDVQLRRGTTVRRRIFRHGYPLLHPTAVALSHVTGFPGLGLLRRLRRPTHGPQSTVDLPTRSAAHDGPIVLLPRPRHPDLLRDLNVSGLVRGWGDPNKRPSL